MNSNLLPTITLHRPWALWVRAGWKTIETRLHDRFKGLEGKWIAIHAGQKWDTLATHTAGAYLSEEQQFQTFNWHLEDTQRGQIVALAFVGMTGWLPSREKYARRAMIETNTARFGLFLDKIIPTTSEIVSGGRGIFTCPVAACRSRHRSNPPIVGSQTGAVASEAQNKDNTPETTPAHHDDIS